MLTTLTLALQLAFGRPAIYQQREAGHFRYQCDTVRIIGEYTIGKHKWYRIVLHSDTINRIAPSAIKFIK